ncbi:MAG TPA: 7-carboxy-7-deazaguanine synthase QueE [Gammaproteobacteria bacterium]
MNASSIATQAEPQLRISEIFISLQGEADAAGWPTVFIRLTGCPLRCTYCDTSYAFSGGTTRPFSEILHTVAEFGVKHVCVTGGEPLAQKGCLELLARLCDLGYLVSLETSGALDVALVDKRVVKVVDIKTPASGEAARNRYENIDYLLPTDQVKLVIASRDDYDWAKAVVARYKLTERCTVLFSPVQGQLAPRQLADWIVEERLPVRFQIQLHKYLWGDEPGR